MHRTLRILSTALVTAGLVVLADVGLTLAYKEPLSTIYGSIQQREAEDQLDELERSFADDAEVRRAASIDDITQRVSVLADLFSERARTGRGIGRIVIPEIDLDVVLVEGTDTATLQKGPGRYPDTAFPGQGRTVGIAGHRTTYLAPFRRLNVLERRDEIRVEMPYGVFVYEVEMTRIVEPSQTEVVRDIAYERVVLTACHPLYSAAQRIVVFGKLKEISLFGGGGAIWQDP